MIYWNIIFLKIPVIILIIDYLLENADGKLLELRKKIFS